MVDLTLGYAHVSKIYHAHVSLITLYKYAIVSAYLSQTFGLLAGDVTAVAQKKNLSKSD